MTNASKPTIERHCDVAVVGGSAAGLAAALQLGRQRRSVIVVDAGEPRNAPAAHMHSFLGHEGLPPSELTAIGREEVRSYGGEVVAGRVVDVTRTDDDRFRLELVGGHTVFARRVVAATGLVDDLPDIEGLADHWGGDVIHCPFCHGFEVRDRRIVQIITHPRGLHPAGLFRQLSAQLTLVLHEGVDADDPAAEALRAAGVDVVADRVQRIVTGEDGHVAAVELCGGDRIAADAVVVTTRFRVRAEPFASLGLRPAEHPTGLGDFVETDATGATSVPGLYAAGNVTDPAQQVLPAAANGSQVGAMISFSLAHEDIEAAARPSANELDWDRRYGGERMWSGNPNGSLVAEIDGLPPGRALDVGAGEGGDAVWLAEQGWNVTASDISQRALDQVTAEAERRDLKIEGHRVDANALGRVRGRRVRPRDGALRVDSPHARQPRGRQPARRGCSEWDAPRGGPRPRADARADRHPRAQSTVRPRRLRSSRRLRDGARRLAGVGDRDPREAPPAGGSRVGPAPRRRRRAARPAARRLTDWAPEPSSAAHELKRASRGSISSPKRRTIGVGSSLAHHQSLNISAVASMGAVAPYADTSSTKRACATFQESGSAGATAVHGLLERLDSQCLAEPAPKVDPVHAPARFDRPFHLVPDLVRGRPVDLVERCGNSRGAATRSLAAELLHHRQALERDEARVHVDQAAAPVGGARMMAVEQLEVRVVEGDPAGSRGGGVEATPDRDRRVDAARDALDQQVAALGNREAGRGRAVCGAAKRLNVFDTPETARRSNARAAPAFASTPTEISGSSCCTASRTARGSSVPLGGASEPGWSVPRVIR